MAVKITNVRGVVVPLTEQQARMVERLRAAHKHYELHPGGNRVAGRSAAGWWRVAGSLMKKGIVRRSGSGVELIVV